MERSTIFNGKTHYKCPFSIAMLNYQRVNPNSNDLIPPLIDLISFFESKGKHPANSKDV